MIDHEVLCRVAGELLPAAPLGQPFFAGFLENLGIRIELEDRYLGVIGIELDQEIDVPFDVEGRFLEGMADDVIGDGEDSQLAAPLEGLFHFRRVGSFLEDLQAFVCAGFHSERDHLQARRLGPDQHLPGDGVDAAAEFPIDLEAAPIQFVTELENLLLGDVEQVVIEPELLVSHGQAGLDLVDHAFRRALAVALDGNVAEGALVGTAPRTEDGRQVVGDA